MKDLIIDCFAGGGGASVGIEMALGRQVDIAINHDPQAIRMHRVNHPDTLHLTEDIFKVDLQKYVAGRHVALMWASPDCTSHSKAKGGQPRKRGLRILPWAVYKHAKKILPDVIIMENVEEIQQWGPLDENGYPILEKRGEDYKKFILAMKSLGYEFDCRELIAADYGAPTTRKRWYAIFRRDGKPIVWPTPTHSKNGDNNLQKWEPIWKYLNLQDWGNSIFGRKKPLAHNTQNRIMRGLDKFVFNNPEPFIVQVNHGGDNFRGQNMEQPLPTITSKHGFGIVTPVTVPFIDKSYGGNYTGSGSGVKEPLHTITTVDHNRLISPVLQSFANSTEENNGSNMNPYSLSIQYLTKFYKSGTGQSMWEPIHTITTSPGHFGQVTVHALPLDTFWDSISKDSNMSYETKDVTDVLQKCTWVSQFIMEYYGCGTGQSLNSPLHTIVTKDRFALITVLGNEYVIMDIYLRMLSPEELKRGQGFPNDYIIDRDYAGKSYPKSEQVARIGNSVVPVMASALVSANCPYLKIGKRMPNMSIEYEKTGQLRFA